MNDLHSQAASAIPVTVLTGFLGSGKTTLLNALLKHPGMADTAVMINEFGDVAIDHLLIRKISDDVVVLNSGCLCCTVRGDLVDGLKELFLKRVRGNVPEFTRVVIETTGLADPAPILHTLMTDPLLGARYRFDGIVTTLDAVNGAHQLDRHPEAVKQIAVADRVVVTKTDLPDGAKNQPQLTARIKNLNPAAPIIVAPNGSAEPDQLFNAGLFNPASKIPEVSRWLSAEAFDHGAGHAHTHHHQPNRHDAAISAFSLRYMVPVAWDGFADAMEHLMAVHGENLLRVKGILYVSGQPGPVAVHAVQHVFHPPVPLDQWPPGEPEQSTLVFITRDLTRDTVKRILATAFF